MARIRTVKPEFWGDPKTARCSDTARLLFIGLLNFSDDEGYQLGSERRILGEVFPNDPAKTTGDIHSWLDELEAATLVHRYVVDQVPYLHICGFTEHQKVQHPSASRLPHEPVMTDLGRGSVGIDLGSDSAPPPWRGSGESPIDFAVHLRAREAGA